MAHTIASGGSSGPFRAREGFDANGEQGVHFASPELPQNLANPSGDGTVVQSEYFWEHSNFIRWDGRQGNLPDPLTEEIVSGEQYAIRLDFGGRPLGRIAVWDGNLRGQALAAITAGGVYGVVLVGNASDGVQWTIESDGFVLGMDSGAWADRSAGQYVHNISGSAQPVTAGTAAGLVINDNGALLWLGDTRLGQAGWAAVDGPNFEFQHTGAAAVGTTPGNWRFLNVQSWLKNLAADADQPTDQRAGDFQTTLQQQGKELKVYANGAWQKLYSEVDVRAWIAALSLFEGTFQEDGGTVANVQEMSALPDLALNTQIDKIAHYYTFTGTPGYVIQATDPSGIGRDLPGTVLNPGDWLQVSNRSGDATAPDLRWSHVGGDLLAKSRGDNLYGLKPWAAGGWEADSLVVHDGGIWRATGPVVGTDTAPGTPATAGTPAGPGGTPPAVPATPAAPWQKIDLAAGVRWVQLDGDLPATASAGEIYFVLQSAQASGAGALYYWDGAANQWTPLGGAGSGDAMDLSGGLPIVSVGVPIGSVQMWLVDALPPGWLLLNGQSFDAGTYPELAQVLGSTQLPDLRGSFVRGAGLNGGGTRGDATRTVGSFQGDSTRAPNNAFTAVAAGSEHQHRSPVHNYATGWRSGGDHDYVLARMGYGQDGNTGQMRFTKVDGAHGHTISGGDSETRPKNFAVHYIIKAADITTRVRN